MIPVFLAAVLVLFMAMAAMFYVGKASNIRTHTQAAADAAALAAVSEIRDRAVAQLSRGLIPYAIGYDAQGTASRASMYAKKNGASVTSIEPAGFLSRSVTVKVKSKRTVGPGIFGHHIGPNRAEAKAIATVDFPLCYIAYNPERPTNKGALVCNNTYQRDIDAGAFVDLSEYAKLFRTRLVAKPPLDLSMLGADVMGPDGLTDRMRRVRDLVISKFNEHNIGGYCPGGCKTGHIKGSDHYSGRAIDIMMLPYTDPERVAKGWKIAHWAVRNADRLGIKYVIYRGRIWTRDEGWHDYTHPSGNTTNPTLMHMDHVHISVLGHDPAPGNVSSPANRRLGQKMAAQAGWTGAQWQCLDWVYQHESGWNQYADNPTSTAYGIPQALPGSKMASAGADWQTNPRTQIRWGIGYIKRRYGTPCSAKSFWLAHNWY